MKLIKRICSYLLMVVFIIAFWYAVLTLVRVYNSGWGNTIVGPTPLGEEVYNESKR